MHRTAWLAAVSGLLMPLAIEAQTTDTARAGVQVSGYVTTSFTHSTHAAESGLAGRLYDRRQNEFMLNTATLTVERPAAANRVDAGFHVELFTGQNAAVVKSAGLDLGPNADVWQAWAVLNLPLHAAGRHVQFRAGKMATLMGVEVGEDVLNPNLGIGSQDIFLEPFTETGAELSAKFGPTVEAQVRVSNGWDQVTDVNTGKTVVARVGLTPMPGALAAIVAYTGPEQAGTNGPKRAGFNVVLSAKPTTRTTAWMQLDYGQEDSLRTDGGKAKWYAAGLWLLQDVSRQVSLALRADYVNDRDGVRTSGVLGFPSLAGQQFGSATATLNFRYAPQVLLRPEIRYDRSSVPAYGGHRDQLSAGLGFSHVF